jgi:hypothetical protein
MKDITGNILRGHLETLVLAVLEKGEAHGFEILMPPQRGDCRHNSRAH